jgi:DNA replicative helicase MCM subunit Mcm2 (Cdc46/Mcm family)
VPLEAFSQLSQSDGIEDIDSTTRPTCLHLHDIHDIQITFSWHARPLHIRDLQSEHVSRLVNVTGYVSFLQLLISLVLLSMHLEQVQNAYKLTFNALNVKQRKM